MHIHILGICGTFMGGLAALAREAGHTVTGSDQNVYPPMSTQLELLGIKLMQGYKTSNLEPAPDLVIVGNAMSRGNEEVEAVFNRGLEYMSGPEWLGRKLLRHKNVIAVAGTHGKTTTSSMLAWILECAELKPGFLIGGVPGNFDTSARAGKGEWFVVEADEYDTAFFDKRSKFVHYFADVAVLNNLEFDHADIFDDLAAIKKQFHHFVRTVPGKGHIVVNADDPNIADVLEMGCWSRLSYFSKTDSPVLPASLDSPVWTVRKQAEDGSCFDVLANQQEQGRVEWALFGEHNMINALAAITAASTAGVSPDVACAALRNFVLPKRRLQKIYRSDRFCVFEDFAHHPTAISETLRAVKSRYPARRLVAVFEPRSNTVKQGHHGDALLDSFARADKSWLLETKNLGWAFSGLANYDSQRFSACVDTNDLEKSLINDLHDDDVIVFMSNGSFGGLTASFTQKLREMSVSEISVL